jgi:hypothetical protein
MLLMAMIEQISLAHRVSVDVIIMSPPWLHKFIKGRSILATDKL